MVTNCGTFTVNAQEKHQDQRFQFEIGFLWHKFISDYIVLYIIVIMHHIQCAVLRVLEIEGGPVSSCSRIHDVLRVPVPGTYRRVASCCTGTVCE